MNAVILLFQIIYFVKSEYTDHGGTLRNSDINREAALEILETIENTTPDSCTGGPGETVDLLLDYSIWEEYTKIPIISSNLLTAVVLRNDCSLDSLTDEAIFYDIVKNNVISGLPTVFGAILAFEPYLYSKYRLFTPYAFNNKSVIESSDISPAYDHTVEFTEWYTVLKQRNWENVMQVTTKTSFRSGNMVLPEEESVLLVAKREDGIWTRPYFDCGGGNIWMVTFSSPIFGRDRNDIPEFKGVATIDIALSDLDVNQCDLGNDKTVDVFFNVFRGTHRCPPTTQCKFQSGFGLRRGGYLCVCKKGYYFPYGHAKGFKGEDIEGATDLSQFRCLPCSIGCHVCVDSKTCLFPRKYRYIKYPKMYPGMHEEKYHATTYEERY